MQDDANSPAPNMLTHPDHPYTFTAPYETADPMSDDDALALNTLKLDQAFVEAKVRKIPEIELEDFINYQLRKAPLRCPALTRTRTPQQREARKILILRIKELYVEKNLTITGNLKAIESVANKVELENGEQWKKCMELAEDKTAAAPTTEQKPISL